MRPVNQLFQQLRGDFRGDFAATQTCYNCCSESFAAIAAIAATF
jgi:hypothetical protein